MEADKLAMLEVLLEHVPSRERHALRRRILRETQDLENVSAASLEALYESLGREPQQVGAPWHRVQEEGIA